MSSLSKQWRSNWLSLQHLNFNTDFCEEQIYENGRCKWLNCCNIISSILFHHNGPVRDFKLYIPEELDEEYLNLSQWLCFLSKNAVTSIRLDNNWSRFYVPSYIFCCTELVHLQLDYFTLGPLPTGFSGFPKLRGLVLVNITFSNEDILPILMAKCPVLAMLKLVNCRGMFHVVIGGRSLETLYVNGRCGSLTFINSRNLKSTSLCLYKLEKKSIISDALNLLTSLCQLQCIQFGGEVCKYLAAGKIPRPFPVTFNKLNKLCLGDLNLDDFLVVDYVFGMIESCPNIKELKITVVPSKTENKRKINYNCKQRLDHLLAINISGITGSNAELKLIEYLLAISVALEKLLFKCGKLDTESELKLSRVLLGFSRASTKARLIHCAACRLGLPEFTDDIEL